jgi:signal transduction histidine kinase
LANAVRHANATSITLSLAYCADGVTLVITDNGSGFYPHEDKVRHGLGLRLVQERIQELGGAFTLQSAPGRGTTLSVSLPQEHMYDSSADR